MDPTPLPPQLEADREAFAHGELPPEALSGLLAELEQARAQEGALERLRALPTPTRVLVALGLAALGPALLLLTAGIKPGVGAGDPGELVIVGLVVALGAVTGARALRSLSRPPSARPWAPVWLALGGLALLVPLSPSLLQGEASPAGEPGPHLVCALIGAALTSLGLLAAWLVRRHGSAVRGGSAGAMAGLAALAALLLHCPYVDSLHQALGHVTVCVLAVGLSATLVGRR